VTLKVSRRTRRELLLIAQKSYQAAERTERIALLKSFIETTGYSRKYAICLLNQSKAHERPRKPRTRALGDEALDALTFVWHVSNQICAKRLRPVLPDVLANLEKHGHLFLSSNAKCQILSVSAATIDRALKTERTKAGKSISLTKRSTLIKNQVPVRTFTEWNDVQPGFFEIDTVGHNSSDSRGPFLATLNMTDIATCWTLPMALPRKGALEVIHALEQATNTIPFPILGLDFDNGTEFLNEFLIEWCEQNNVTYTRSRAYKKNDQAWIEEKNRSVVRRNVGRDRYESDEALDKLTRLYSVLNLYLNFFLPCQKLLTKTRDGAKVRKNHDVAKTPYRRVLEHPEISPITKLVLSEQYRNLDMFSLFRELSNLQTELKELAVEVPNPLVAAALAQRNATYLFTQKLTKPLPKEHPDRTTLKRIRETIRALPTGTPVKSKDFEMLISRSEVSHCLTDLCRSRVLTRVGLGLYEKSPPRQKTPNEIELFVTNAKPGTTLRPRDFKTSELHKRTIQLRLKKLEEQGMIAKIKNGLYVISQKPETTEYTQNKTGAVRK
jgi:hypothetical protein